MITDIVLYIDKMYNNKNMLDYVKNMIKQNVNLVIFTENKNIEQVKDNSFKIFNRFFPVLNKNTNIYKIIKQNYQDILIIDDFTNIFTKYNKYSKILE